jgi:hypothetical protein
MCERFSLSGFIFIIKTAIKQDIPPLDLCLINKLLV